MKDSTIHTAHIYRMYEDTGRYAIEVAVDDYDDIFNEWDPAPFKRRDLDPELQCFLEECSRDIALKHPLAVVFYMPSTEHNSEKESLCIAGIKNHFALKIHVLEKKQNRVFHEVVRNMVIGIFILSFAVIFDAYPTQNLLFKILGQGLFIGGWVFIWEAIATIGFKNSSLQSKIKEWRRFLEAPIVFKKEPFPESTSV